MKKSIKTIAGAIILTMAFLGCSPRKQIFSENNFVPSGAQTQTAPLNSELNKSVIVYITKTGSKYHTSYCRYLKNSKIKTELEKSRQTHQPCLVCSPPE